MIELNLRIPNLRNIVMGIYAIPILTPEFDIEMVRDLLKPAFTLICRSIGTERVEW